MNFDWHSQLRRGLKSPLGCNHVQPDIKTRLFLWDLLESKKNIKPFSLSVSSHFYDISSSLGMNFFKIYQGSSL